MPLSRQGWLRLTFLHWRYDVSVLQPLLPPGVRAQTLDGTGWVGVTPFVMDGVRPAGPVPAVPGWSTFPEINVRTYVRGPDGRDGLWFLSLACPRRAVIGALRLVGLPYERAHGQVRASPDGSTWRYRFRPAGPSASAPPPLTFNATVKVGAPLTEDARTDLVESLTGRWGAYTRPAGWLRRVPVDHPVWPLHAATARGSLTAPLLHVGLPEPSGEPWVHFSPGVRARVGGPLSPDLREGHRPAHRDADG